MSKDNLLKNIMIYAWPFIVFSIYVIILRKKIKTSYAEFASKNADKMRIISIREYVKQREAALIKEYGESDPDYLDGKKLTFVLLIIYAAVRVLDPLLGVVFSLLYDIPFTSKYASIGGAIIFGFCFPVLIYRLGQKVLVYILLLFSIASIILFFRGETYLLLTYDDIGLRILGVSLAVFLVILTVVPALVSASKKCRTYLDITRKINKELNIRSLFTPVNAANKEAKAESGKSRYYYGLPIRFWKVVGIILACCVVLYIIASVLELFTRN